VFSVQKDNPGGVASGLKTENQRDSASYKGKGLMFGAGSATVAKAKNNRKLKTSSGFTFVELVVALGIGAMVIAVSIMAYGTINSQGTSRRQLNVNIGINNAFAFYGWTDPQTAVSEAPSFAATAMANSLRDQFLGDISSASAVVCLARNLPNVNTLRPTNLAIPTNMDVRTLVSPDNFRTNLIDPSGAVYINFNASTNTVNGATVAMNSTVYMLYAAANSTNVTVDAIYEADWVAVTNAPVGVYASVRRYVGTNMTGYYHVFYPNATRNPTNRPAAAFFNISSATNGDSRYRKAENRPFYFVWWPDPSQRDLNSTYPTETTNAANARSDYMLNSGGTSYFFAVPAFPAL